MFLSVRFSRSISPSFLRTVFWRSLSDLAVEAFSRAFDFTTRFPCFHVSGDLRDFAKLFFSEFALGSERCQFSGRPALVVVETIVDCRRADRGAAECSRCGRC
jgi:hypothetical protein